LKASLEERKRGRKKRRKKGGGAILALLYGRAYQSFYTLNEREVDAAFGAVNGKGKKKRRKKKGWGRRTETLHLPIYAWKKKPLAAFSYCPVCTGREGKRGGRERGVGGKEKRDDILSLLATVYNSFGPYQPRKGSGMQVKTASEPILKAAAKGRGGKKTGG